MNNDALVTVLLPVYNRPQVTETIDSVLSQTYKNFELLIIDNASTDNTVDVIREYSDDRIRLVQNKVNIGQTGSLNIGLKEAKGKYIARIDSDDIALPERLEKQVNYMEANPKCVLCGSWVRIIKDDGNLTFILRVPDEDKSIRVMQTFGCAFFHPSIMMRAKIIRDKGIQYNPKIIYAEDYDMWARMLKYGSGHNIQEVLTYYRRGDDSDSNKHAKEMKEEAFVIQNKQRKKIRLDEIRQKMNKLSEIEGKNKKSVLCVIKMIFIYRQFLNRTIDKHSDDYGILKRQMKMKIYKGAVAYNEAFWARLMKSIYKFTKKAVEKRF